MGNPQRPYSRAQYNRALIVNAAFKELNVLVLAGVLAAGLLLGHFWLAVPLALVVYAAAAVITYFNQEEQDEVLARERAKRKAALKSGERRIDPQTLASPIRRLLSDAFQKETRIREAIERAELPYAEVSEEADGFIRTMESTASRAQLLYEGLEDTPVAHVEQRLNELEQSGDPTKRELIEALTHQLAIQRKMETQLERFYDRMERILVELDTVRGQLVSLSASTEAENQRLLAREVRSLREETGALAEGMTEAFEERA